MPTSISAAALAKRACRRFLSYDYPETPRQRLLKLAERAGDDAEMDAYGSGVLLDQLERRVAGILGKESAVFMPAGRTAQLIALKLWCARRGNLRVAMHPRCHLEEHESKAYAHVCGLSAVPVGGPARQVTPGDLKQLAEPVGAITVEVPLLSLGCVLPPWNDLVAMSAWASAHDTPFHADGARLWESEPYYGHSCSELAGLFDSIYVSFYKGLNGIAGGALAGSEEFIREARVWQHRFGAAPFRQFPMVLDALRGLDESLPLMPEFHRRAQELAAALSPLALVVPSPPHTNTFRVALRGSLSSVHAAAVQVAERLGIWLFDAPIPTEVDGLTMFQVVVGPATLAVTDAEAVEAVTLLLHLVAAD